MFTCVPEKGLRSNPWRADEEEIFLEDYGSHKSKLSLNRNKLFIKTIKVF